MICIVYDVRHRIIQRKLQLGLDQSGAMAWAAVYHAEIELKFIDNLPRLPSWDAILDAKPKEFLERIANMVRPPIAGTSEVSVVLATGAGKSRRGSWYHYFPRLGVVLRCTDDILSLPICNYRFPDATRIFSRSCHTSPLWLSVRRERRKAHG
ncbi:hypothetical protein EDC04DRAFT_1209808 [Pisolithus marmoratus]|nr:hypothetical protein EDC04DRAFT_1209808 [Pisolithus marmoratus]